MDTKPLIGLAGVVVAVSFSELNDQVGNLALADIAGGLGIGQDAAGWLRTLYLLGYVMGAITGPSLAVIFTPRRFLLGGVLLTVATSLLFVVSDALPLLYGARLLQGVGEGMIISNLIAVALRALPPAIRLYGLIFYAMTATLIPALATSLAALWTGVAGDWRLIFIQSVPLAVVAGVLIWEGLPDQPMQLGKLRSYDWPGLALGVPAFGSLAVVFGEGERFDWFNSPVITLLALTGAITLPLFVWRELVADPPLMGLDLLKRRNLLYPASALVIFIVLGLSASQVPVTFLQTVQGYRPEQAHWVTLEIAAAQIVLLPAVAWLLDQPWVDARVVGASGLLLIAAGCLGGLLVDGTWTRDQFVPLQALQAVGQPLVVMPLLLIATNALTPEEGPFGSALVNAPRALAEAGGAGLIVLVGRFRGALHRDRLLDQIGQTRIFLAHAHGLPASLLHPATGGRGPGAAALQALGAAVQRETAVLTAVDTYIVMAALAGVLFLMQVFIPERTYPPRIALAGQG